jgi:hypothetical protein
MKTPKYQIEFNNLSWIIRTPSKTLEEKAEAYDKAAQIIKNTIMTSTEQKRYERQLDQLLYWIH